MWQLRCLCFAIFCVHSPWTAGLEEPQHRRSRSPSRSSHSWNTLPLNNELNLGCASGGDLGAALSSVQGFVAHMRVLVPTSTHSHIPACCHYFLPQVVLWETLRWLAVEEKKAETNRAGRHRRIATTSEWRREICRQQGWEAGRLACVLEGVQQQFPSSSTPPVPLGVHKRCFNWEREDGSEKKGRQCAVVGTWGVRWKRQPLDTELMNGHASHPWLRFKRCGWVELKGVSSSDESADLSESPSPRQPPRGAH